MAGRGCSVGWTEVAGWRAAVLDDGAVTATVLPDKGADIYALVDRRTGVDVLFKAPWGLQPPGSPPRAGSDGMAFLANYEGAWQELLPNTNDPCEVGGRTLPFHGEVVALPWTVVAEDAGPDGLRLDLAVDCRLVPLRLERSMRMAAGAGRLVLDERVTNLGDAPERFVWGHHCVLGAPLVAAGARLDVDCGTVVTIPDAFEETARLAPGQRSRWPHAALRAGGEADLREVLGPEARSHDDVYLTDLASGRAAVENAALGLGFALSFDPQVFRWVIAWQPFGGADAMPLTGAYALGVEPWAAGGNLTRAIAQGQALELAPGASLSTCLEAAVYAV